MWNCGCRRDPFSREGPGKWQKKVYWSFSWVERGDSCLLTSKRRIGSGGERERLLPPTCRKKGQEKGNGKSTGTNKSGLALTNLGRGSSVRGAINSEGGKVATGLKLVTMKKKFSARSTSPLRGGGHRGGKCLRRTGRCQSFSKWLGPPSKKGSKSLLEKAGTRVRDSLRTGGKGR